jgi:molybdopterin converting factor small subunit
VIRSARFAVNREYQQPQTVLQHGDEVAFIPPVAGGGASDGPESES